MDPIVIIGTGLAGYGVARELRKHDRNTPVTLITRDDGASYYKPDISEAHSKGAAAKDLVKKDADAMAAALDARIHTYQQVEAIDRESRAVEISGDTLGYSKLVLAFGADPIRLGLGGDAVDAIHKVNNLLDYRTLRDNLAGASRVAILGAGLIGCEFANDLTGAGYRVSVADPSDWPLSQLIPRECGAALQSELARAGVHWHLGHAATAIQQGGRDLEIVLDNDDVVHADVVLSAVGLRAGTELAAAAGLAIDRGIRVDRGLRTSDDNIYALGDCAEVAGHWRPYVGPLMQCARTLGKNLGTGQANQVRYPPLPIFVKTHVCPVIAYPPLHRHGQWQISGKKPNVEARFVDDENRTLGFALTGKAGQKSREYMRQAPPLLE